MRALAIIGAIWLFAMGVTSPMLFVSQYGPVEYHDGSAVPSCGTSFGRPWRRAYILASMALLFVLPFFVLLLVYALIARQLVRHRALGGAPSERAQLRARRQLVRMLAAVVLSFFVCLLPYRLFILWILVSPEPVETQARGGWAAPARLCTPSRFSAEKQFSASCHNRDVTKLNPPQRVSLEVFYSLLYLCRVMLYLNSAINPILYNAISSKFRDAFCRLLCLRRRRLLRQSTTNTHTSSSLKSRSSLNAYHSVVSVSGSGAAAKNV
ncbi:kiSS-1 receptor-like [Haemaphysalis longicornis]